MVFFVVIPVSVKLLSELFSFLLCWLPLSSMRVTMSSMRMAVSSMRMTMSTVGMT